MYTSDFDFFVPKSLVSYYPKICRSECKLLLLNALNGKIKHGIFKDILNQIQKGDLIIFNNTKVIPAKIFGYTYDQKKITILIEKILSKKKILGYIFAKDKLPKIGNILFLGKIKVKTIITNKKDRLFEVLFLDKRTVFELLNIIGNIPLPPYILRSCEKIDEVYYQTVYAKYFGSNAAPTAGLHFDLQLLNELKKKGVFIEYITLHIGSGTFLPVRSEKIQDHIMHNEYAEVSEKTIRAIIDCKKRGNSVIAVGTSTVRAIESAAQFQKDSLIIPFFSQTKIFIYPGYKYHNIIDAIITNFHFPKSTLIMLISAFAGHYNIMKAYQEAIKNNYKFFSYGDAMFISQNF